MKFAMTASATVRQLAGLALAGALLLAPATAHAHVTEGAGSISAELHINPNDDPVAGEPALLGFSLKDVTGRFASQNCACVLVVERAGHPAVSQVVPAVNKASQNVLLVPYEFPGRDVYNITLKGQPSGGVAFEPFSLTYTIRVARGDVRPRTAPPPLWPVYGLLGGAAGAGILLAVNTSPGRKPQP